LQENWREKNAAYSLVVSPFKNWWAGKEAAGNCSYWTGHGLKSAGILPHSSMWPKELWLRLYQIYHRAEKHQFKGCNLMHIVSYRRIKGLNSYGANVDPSSWVKPGSWYSSYKYGSLEYLADLIVEVPDHQKSKLAVLTARTHVKPRKKRDPSAFKFVHTEIDDIINHLCTRFWKQIDYTLESTIKFISVSGNGIIWAIDDKSDLFRWNGRIFVPCNYRHYICQTRTHNLLRTSRYRKEVFNDLVQQEEEEEMAIDVESLDIVRVSVGEDNSTFGVLKSGRIFFLIGNNKISDSDNGITGIDEDKVCLSAPSRIIDISVIDRENLWAVTEKNEVYKCTSGVWEAVPGCKLSCIDICEDSVWGISEPDKAVVRFIDGIWETIEVPTTEEISSMSGSGKEVWVTTENSGAIFVYDEMFQRFCPLGNESKIPISFVSLNSKCTAWGLTETREMFRLSKHRLQVTKANDFLKMWDDRDIGARPFDLAFWKGIVNLNEDDSPLISMGPSPVIARRTKTNGNNESKEEKKENEEDTKQKEKPNEIESIDSQHLENSEQEMTEISGDHSTENFQFQSTPNHTPHNNSEQNITNNSNTDTTNSSLQFNSSEHGDQNAGNNNNHVNNNTCASVDTNMEESTVNTSNNKTPDDNSPDSNGTNTDFVMMAEEEQEDPLKFYPIGDIAERSNLSEPMGTTFMVREIFDLRLDYALGIEPLLEFPLDYKLVWHNNTLKCGYGDISIWKPIPPPGYQALGYVTEYGKRTKPHLNQVCCVNEQILKKGKIFTKEHLWTSKTTGASKNLSVWLTCDDKDHFVNTFVVNTGRNYTKPPDEDVYFFDFDPPCESFVQ